MNRPIVGLVMVAVLASGFMLSACDQPRPPAPASPGTPSTPAPTGIEQTEEGPRDDPSHWDEQRMRSATPKQMPTG